MESWAALWTVLLVVAPPGGDSATTLSHETEDRLLEDIDWAAMYGKRAKRAVEFCTSSRTAVVLSILAVVKEPLRFLTKGFLHCAASVQDPNRHPHLLDYVTPRFSRVTVAMQHLSSLLVGNSSRLQLVLLAAGAGTIAEWKKANPEHAQLLRRCLLTAATWIYRRHMVLLAE